MHKTKASDAVRSPSITPQSATSKQTMNKKKPPAYSKPKPQDLKNLKLRQKPKKNRTNSITPKTLKSSIYDRVFHNSNLSDTDISSKFIDASRPTSKISKSLINRLELTQKVKDFKKPAPIIDQIIKKSLHKAKRLKNYQEKENKKVEMKKELRKYEMCAQNNQIRVENSAKYKKRKKSARRQEGVKVRSESSSKVRNYTSLFIEPAAKNKRSVSIGEYYSNMERRSDTALLDYIEEKNKKRIEEEDFEYLHQRAREISKADRLHSLEVFTKNQRMKSPKARKSLSKSYSEKEEYEEKPEEVVERNISFIEDNSDLDSISLDEEAEFKPTVSDYEIEKNGRKGNMGVYLETESVEDPRVQAAVVIQRAFRQHLIRMFLKTKKKQLTVQYCKDLSVIPRKRFLKIENQKQKIVIAGLKPKPKKCSVDPQSAKVCINPKKPTLVLRPQQKVLVKPQKVKRNLQIGEVTNINYRPLQKVQAISPQYTFTIFPDKQCKSDSGQLHDQLKEQIAWNSAQVYIIEQLRSEELAQVSAIIANDEIRERTLEKIHKKYQTLLSVMKDAMDYSQSDYLENMSVDEYSKFEKNKQSKQELLHKVLISSDESPSKGFSLNLDLVECTDQGVQPSSDLSSDDGEVPLGISHSRSLSQLHGDINIGKYVSPSQVKETLNPKFPMFFDLDEPIEVQSINLLAGDSCDTGSSIRNLPSLPNLPMLHLDVMQKEQLYSEPRILTSTDSILDYIKSVITNLDFAKIENELKKPLERDFLEELQKLQEKELGEPLETKIFEFPQLLDWEQILSCEASSSELESTMRQINKADKIHKKMLVDVLNIQIQQFRPNGFNGRPASWSCKVAAMPKALKIGEITEKVLRDLEVFSLFQIGRIFNEEIISSNGGIDEGLIQSLREDRLERLIFFETVEEESEWVDYEFEETQVKFDVADMVLEHLAEEVEQILDKLINL